MFSTIEVVVCSLNGLIDHMLLAALRFFGAGAVLILIGWIKGEKIPQKAWLNVLLCSFIGITVTFTAYHTSLQYISASVGATLFSINPIFCAILATIFMREKLHWIAFLGLIFGFIGVWIIISGNSLGNSDSILGSILMLIASLGFSFYIVSVKKFTQNNGPFLITGATFFIGSIPIFILVNKWQISGGIIAFMGVGYLIFFASALAYILYFIGLRKVSVAAGTSLFYLKPVIATLLSTFFLHEKIDTQFIIGLIIVLVSLFLVNLPLHRSLRRQ